MKAELVIPFIVAAAEVLRAEAGVSVRRGQLALSREAIRTDDVATLIGLVGDVEGLIVFSLPRETCLGLVSCMLGQPHDELDALARSGTAEFGNVVAGRGATKLSLAGYQVDITVPTMVIGRGTSVTPPQTERLVVPLQTELGSLEVHLALREA